MSVASPVANELFTLRTFKRLASNPAVGWANSYEIRMGASPSAGGLEDVCVAVVAFEQVFHLTTVEFDRYVVSTLQPDGSPYDPLSFTSFPLSPSTGARTSAGQPLDLKVCLFVRRDVQYGRDGRALYRGVLTETDVQAPAGQFTLTDPTGFQTDLINAALVSSNLADYLALGGEADKIVMSNSDGTIVRDVADMTAVGVSVKKLNNRFYNRVPTV